MIREIKKLGLYSFIAVFNREHPYLFSFAAASLILSFILFWAPPLDVARDAISPYENIQFINIEQTDAPRRVVKKEISQDESSPPDDSVIERASGISDLPDAVDLSFYPSIAPPKPIGRFMKLYPRSAREMNIEARIDVEVLISPSGRVQSVDILSVRLSKALPPELHDMIARDFARDARRILMEARFTPPIVDGKNVPVRMDMPMRFRLE